LKHETRESVEFLPIFDCQAPPGTNAKPPTQKRKAPLLKPFWRRFWLPPSKMSSCRSDDLYVNSY